MRAPRPLRFGVLTLQPFFDSFEGVVACARRCEALGFDSFWLGDHLTQAPRPAMVRLEAWTLLAALAAHTSRIRLGILVTSITFRHPTLLAAQAATVDQISGGRLELGIGAAGTPADYAVMGLGPWPPAERVGRLREQAAILDGLLRGQLRAYEGRYYQVREASRLTIVQSPRPPLVVAAHGPRSLRVVARHADCWNSVGGQIPLSADRVPLDEAIVETRRQSELLDRFCAEAGRDPRAIRRSVHAYRAEPRPFSSVGAFCDFVGRYREVGIDEFVFTWPFRRTSSYGYAPVPEEEAILEHIAADAIPALRRGYLGGEPD
jgi:alkanesulfonate monooxygenase SsuD/methylene tetrahydromethanopterin reductase-like flavin-dependent oxidoreductase (luciferase family)